MLALVAILLAFTLAGIGWMLHALLRQNGRLLLRVEALEAELDRISPSRTSGRTADAPVAKSRINRAGLPAGSIAPPFRLPLLDGGEVSLADFSGRKLLLVFSDPSCAPCMALLPRLESAARHAGVAVLVISRGPVDANRRKIEETRFSLPVALQAHWEISRLYAKFSTPMAYLIDERGRTMADVASGGAQILALLASRADIGLSEGPTHVPGSRLTH